MRLRPATKRSSLTLDEAGLGAKAAARDKALRQAGALGEAAGKEDHERGSALMLVPAGFLVLMLLAALTVDSAVAYLGQRQLDDAITAAANDAATAGLSNAAFYRSGAVTLDPTSTAEAVCQSIAAQGDNGLGHLHIALGVSGPEVEVRATATVKAVFGSLVPGFSTRDVSAEVTADAQRGPTRDDTPPSTVTPIAC